MRKFKQSFILFSLLMFFCAGVFGIALGLLLANTVNTKNIENFTEFTTALPTRLLDINGELITEFSSDEKRELITIDRLPQHMLNALLTREDRTFYRHRGYSIKALVRAVGGQLAGKDLGGGSTLTQQIAGTLYCDRSEKSIKRKIKELWWAIQMERRYSKNDILEIYLNKIYLGGGTYGVNAASKYYFGHPASEISPAEAAILVIQLSNPAAYNPFEHPSVAQNRQQYVLDEMVSLGFLTKEEATESFDDYWATFDYTRTGTSVYFMREDKAPWFSEYVLRELNSLIYGKADIYTGGFTVNTTMNLKHQLAAQDIMARTLEYANNTYRKSSGSRSSDAVSTYIPMVEMLSLLFDIPKLKVGQERTELVTRSTFEDQINPILDIFSLICGIDSLKTEVINRTNAKQKQDSSKTTIEGAFISLENETGYITALVGGSKFDAENQFIRATQALVQPGSTFKPLYYSAAIDSKKFTATTQIDDSPVIFYNEDNIPYIPNNFKGEWLGTVQLWYALAKSMNIPSLKIFDGVGFDAAFERASALLGIPKEELNARHFDRVYPSALGICSIRPIELARAFAIFANQGKAVTPFAIRSVEDRNGKVFENPEARIRSEQKKLGSDIQVISPQTAYIMTDILTNSVRMGTLAYGVQWGAKLQYKNSNGDRYQMPAAGKTGTTQNWTNAWAVGYTPYYTAALWFGFDQPGQSLGLELTGSTLAGPAWGDFMRIANEDMPYKEFPIPQTGLVKATVCSVSGKLLTAECGDHTTTKYYLEGTQPTTVCEYHKNREAAKILAKKRLENERYMSGVMSQAAIIDDSDLKADLSFLDDNYGSEEEQQEEKESFSWSSLFSFGNKKNKEQESQNEPENTENSDLDPFGMNSQPEQEKSDQPENFLFD
ncbi:MAG: PBP1A family penicillin-binding protein [Spirochaetaceae bacterium]|nr:PBP1A family penicillin-binding protein [Spirochaetaceae bacterium]